MPSWTVHLKQPMSGYGYEIVFVAFDVFLCIVSGGMADLII